MVKEILPILHDSQTVWEMLEYRGNKTNVSPENVAEVLAAIVACIECLPD